MPDLEQSKGSSRYAVIGGGITGLTAAYRLTQLLPDASVDLYEASGQLGGVLQTDQTDELLIELGADSFFNKLPWAIDLCHELGLEDELIATNEERRRAFVLKDDRLQSVPAGFVIIRPQQLGPILKSPVLSWRGKLRLLCEGWISKHPEIDDPDFDESVASFAIRRLGREAFERLVQPLLAGIYTADPYKLSLAATMPEIIEAVREHGSLRKAILASQDDQHHEESGARYRSFMTPRGGLKRLVEELANRLQPDVIHLNSQVSRLTQSESGKWIVELDDLDQQQFYDGVIVALPAPRAADLVCNIDYELQKLLGSIPYASSAVACMAYHHEQIQRDFSGFGFVVPTIENRKIIAASFSNMKFAGRAPENQLLVRVFLGGALQAELLEMSDDELCDLAHKELYEILAILDEPYYAKLVRWQEKMPQYHVGHVQLVRKIEERAEQFAGLEFAGNAYHGVGIPQCIHSGDCAARRLLRY